MSGDSYNLEHSDVWITCHENYACNGGQCPVHNKTNHLMRNFPQVWRSDIGAMERQCPHVIGHPDPDDLYSVNNIHGCDGCCSHKTFFEQPQDSINQEAHKIINGARQSAYGDPSESFARVARLWSEILGVEVTSEQVLLCMIQLKVSRAINRHSRDNYVDIAGYAGLIEMLGEEKDDE